MRVDWSTEQIATDPSSPRTLLIDVELSDRPSAAWNATMFDRLEREHGEVRGFRLDTIAYDEDGRFSLEVGKGDAADARRYVDEIVASVSQSVGGEL